MNRIKLNIFLVSRSENFNKYKMRINYKKRQATIIFEQSVHSVQITEGKDLLYNFFLDSTSDLNSFKNFCWQQREDNYEHDIVYLKSLYDFIKENTVKLKKVFQEDFKTFQELVENDDYGFDLGRYIMYSQFHI